MACFYIYTPPRGKNGCPACPYDFLFMHLCQNGLKHYFPRLGYKFVCMFSSVVGIDRKSSGRVRCLSHSGAAKSNAGVLDVHAPGKIVTRLHYNYDYRHYLA